MPDIKKQGVNSENPNSSETPSEQAVVDNDSVNTSDTNYQQSSSGDVKSDTAKMYTEEEVNRILHMRTKEYSDRMKQYEEMLSKYIQNAPDIKPESKNDGSDLSDEDKAFINYLKAKVIPHLKDEILPKEYLGFIEALREREIAQVNMFMDSGEKTLLEQMKKDGIPNESLDIVKETVASIILNSNELQSKFVMRDHSVFIDAYKKFAEAFNKQIKDKAKEEIKKIVQTKENVINVKQPVNEGIGRSATEVKKLTDEEFIESAFKRLSGK